MSSTYRRYRRSPEGSMRVKWLTVKFPSGCADAAAGASSASAATASATIFLMPCPPRAAPPRRAPDQREAGVGSSARLSHRSASGSLPRQRSIMPRWKKSDASTVPSRRARFEYGSASSQRPLRSSAQASASSPVTLGRRLAPARASSSASRSDPVVGVEDGDLEIAAHAVPAAADGWRPSGRTARGRAAPGRRPGTGRPAA